MVGMKILSPEFPSPLTPYENDAPALENFTENAAFSACDFTRAALADAEFSHVKFIGCKFVSADLRRADFCDAVFENCDFSGAILRGAALRRARLEGCKGMGADFSEGYFADTVAGKCNFSYANFGGTKFKAVRFANCNFSDCSLSRMFKLRTSPAPRAARCNRQNAPEARAHCSRQTA